jgi:hypothetical protein
MSTNPGGARLVKVVYFDEESASDLLDITAGGREVSSTAHIQERSKEAHANADAAVSAKLKWLSFFGASAEVAAGVKGSAVGRNILNKTISNTILTDYLDKSNDIVGVTRLDGLRVTASNKSAAYMKMYAPYMSMLKLEDAPITLSGLNEMLATAKGYYELLARDDHGAKKILRFNIHAFRNSYGLVDLARMNLTFHAVLVGSASEGSLTMEAEMAPSDSAMLPSVEHLVGRTELNISTELNVYDVVLAGVEHGS